MLYVNLIDNQNFKIALVCCRRHFSNVNTKIYYRLLKILTNFTLLNIAFEPICIDNIVNCTTLFLILYHTKHRMRTVVSDRLSKLIILLHKR